MTAKDKPVSKPASDEYRSNYDKIFGGKMKSKIETLRDAYGAATYGVWVSRFVTCEMTDKDPPYAEQTVQTPTGLIEVKGLREGEDAAFIALSHNLMPELLAFVDAVRDTMGEENMSEEVRHMLKELEGRE